VAGIPVTSVSRTILDLATVLDRQGLERAMNEAEVRRLRSRLSLSTLLGRYPRRPGSACLRALLREHSPAAGVTRNEFEDRFRDLVDAHGLPVPRFNADLAVGGRFFEIDCLWSDHRLIVELDGRAVHGTPHAFEADRERDRLLLVEGWRVARVTWRQLSDAPSVLVADLRGLLVQAAA
jgi:very-short-patch-repair endonuclease